jgi:hypothetical protein
MSHLLFKAQMYLESRSSVLVILLLYIWPNLWISALTEIECFTIPILPLRLRYRFP